MSEIKNGTIYTDGKNYFQVHKVAFSGMMLTYKEVTEAGKPIDGVLRFAPIESFQRLSLYRETGSHHDSDSRTQISIDAKREYTSLSKSKPSKNSPNLNLTLYGQPITKKNSQRIFKRPNGGWFIKPSNQYEKYEEACIRQISKLSVPIDYPCNVKCIYYMKTKRKVDLTNLLEASDDILIHAGILKDDNSKIVASHDGSRVKYDRENPRVEIEIMELESEQ